MLVFDLETGPLPEDVIRDRMPPYEPPPPPGEFDPNAVKTGNLVDPAKIRAKIAGARGEHIDAVAGYEASLVTREAEYWAKIIDKAALSPVTGQVVAIGYLWTDTGIQVLDHSRPEGAMLETFWHNVEEAIHSSIVCVGHNIEGFDLPFAVQRSWMLDVDVPCWMTTGTQHDRRRWFGDTMIRWSQGARGPASWVKLDLLARLLGVGQKPDDVDGGMFAGLLKTDPEKALAYLANDLVMTRGVAERLGLL